MHGLAPADDRSPHHFQGDALWFAAHGLDWDLLIAHPPCTYLCNSGVHMLTEEPGRYERSPDTLIGPARWDAMRSGATFFRELLNTNIRRVCIENPVIHHYAREIVGRSTQVIQPYNFGEDASKATCLWLRNLPRLRPTRRIAGRIVKGREVWGNQTDSGQNSLPPSDDRAQIRSQTYAGIAEAMAEQWGGLCWLNSIAV